MHRVLISLAPLLLLCGCSMSTDDSAYVLAVEYSPDGRLLLCRENTGLRLRTADGQVVAESFVAPTRSEGRSRYSGGRAQFFDSGKRVAVFGGWYDVPSNPRGNTLEHGATMVLTVGAFDKPTEYRTHKDSANRVGDVSPDGRYFVVATSFNRESTVLVRDNEREADRAFEFFAHRAPDPHSEDKPLTQCHVSDVRFSPNGKLLATAGGDKKVQLWDATDGFKAAGELVGHTKPVLAIAFAPDSKFLASVAWDGTARIWNLKDRKEVRSIALKNKTHLEELAVAFSPDGKLLATADNHEANLWDAATGELVRKLPTALPGPCGVAFSPDGKFVAVAACDSPKAEARRGGIEQFEVATGKPRALKKDK
jgi:WD40 repeat protein